MEISIGDVIIAHPLLMAACTIVFGMRLSLVLGLMILAINQLLVEASWYNTGFNYLASVVIPCGVTRLLLLAIEKVHIQNLFLFILGGGFVGGILSILACASISIAVLWLFQPEIFNAAHDFTLMYILLMYPEGFCNGLIVTSLAVMKPHLVKTYNDRFYIDGDDRA